MTHQKSLYDLDFHAWCYNQAALLAKGKFEEADINHVIEELEDMGNAERKELINRVSQLFLHLLKWKYQSERVGNSWKASIKDQRVRIQRLLEKNPSLKSSLFEACEEGYGDGRRMAWEETGINSDVFPEENPFSYPDFLQDGWLPE